jgi:hypothetical protein
MTNKVLEDEQPSLTYAQQWLSSWNRFWFTRRDPAVLGVLRILVGGMLLYTHLIWSFELSTFFGGEEALLPSSLRETLVPNASYRWSHFDWIGPALLWPAHIAALLVFAMFTVGVLTRITGVFSALLVISYANRATGTQFGLDQINCFLAVYLALGPSGQFLSVDRWLHRKEQGRAVEKSTMANLSIRLIQVHLCIVYLFAGMGKLLGDRWWNGDAIWGAVANYEYQTIELTWLSEWMWLVNLITYGALIWEVCYPFLIWPRLTRPLFLCMAICVHLGIGISMGMMTFGLIMVFANLSFISSDWIRGASQKWLPASLL